MCLHKRCEFIGRSGEFFIKHKEKTQTNQHKMEANTHKFFALYKYQQGIREGGKKKVKNSNNQSK